MFWEINMLERLVETFCAVDDFCQAFLPQWEAYLIRNGTAPRGPQPGLCVSEIMTILLMLHGSRCKYLRLRMPSRLANDYPSSGAQKRADIKGHK